MRQWLVALINRARSATNVVRRTLISWGTPVGLGVMLFVLLLVGLDPQVREISYAAAAAMPLSLFLVPLAMLVGAGIEYARSFHDNEYDHIKRRCAIAAAAMMIYTLALLWGGRLIAAVWGYGPLAVVFITSAIFWVLYPTYYISDLWRSALRVRIVYEFWRYLASLVPLVYDQGVYYLIYAWPVLCGISALLSLFAWEWFVEPHLVLGLVPWLWWVVLSLMLGVGGFLLGYWLDRAEGLAIELKSSGADIELGLLTFAGIRTLYTTEPRRVHVLPMFFIGIERIAGGIFTRNVRLVDILTAGSVESADERGRRAFRVQVLVELWYRVNRRNVVRFVDMNGDAPRTLTIEEQAQREISFGRSVSDYNGVDDSLVSQIRNTIQSSCETRDYESLIRDRTLINAYLIWHLMEYAEPLSDEQFASPEPSDEERLDAARRYVERMQGDLANTNLPTRANLGILVGLLQVTQILPPQEVSRASEEVARTRVDVQRQFIEAEADVTQTAVVENAIRDGRITPQTHALARGAEQQHTHVFHVPGITELGGMFAQLFSPPASQEPAVSKRRRKRRRKDSVSQHQKGDQT